MKKRPARLEDRNGATLKGVVVEPDSGKYNRELGFIYLPGVVMGVTAVHTVGFKLAERLADEGYLTSLIDPPGVGESEGDFPPGTHEEVSDFIVEGNLVEGCMDIVDWMRRELGIERVAFLGHCGGALTGVECAARHEAVPGVFMICPPPLRGKKGEKEIERPEIADQYFKLYAQKIFSPERWKRLFTGETDYGTLATVVRSKAGRFIISKLKLSSGAAGDEDADDDRNFNLLVVDAMKRSVEQDKTVTVVFGEKDIEINNYRDLHRKFVDPRIPLVVIEDTSHGFTTADGQARLLDLGVQFAREVAAKCVGTTDKR
ncbi:MAG: alpha/beta fold hydrolase [Candidatus Latescibacterota bacterium]|jgi:pimeloyl-ACP methyl ester carboxylesterase